MFTRPDQLAKKGGPQERLSYLEKLKSEFISTKSLEARKQLLANLANFAYDPLNFEFLKTLQVVDLFLEQLSHKNQDLICYALGGICNVSNDPEFAAYIVLNNGVYLINQFLDLDSNSNIEVAITALTTLIFLAGSAQGHLVTTPEVITKVSYLKDHLDTRIRNLANIFLSDYCNPKQTVVVG